MPCHDRQLKEKYLLDNMVDSVNDLTVVDNLVSSVDD